MSSETFSHTTMSPKTLFPTPHTSTPAPHTSTPDALETKNYEPKPEETKDNKMVPDKMLSIVKSCLGSKFTENIQLNNDCLKTITGFYEVNEMYLFPEVYRSFLKEVFELDGSSYGSNIAAFKREFLQSGYCLRKRLIYNAHFSKNNLNFDERNLQYLCDELLNVKASDHVLLELTFVTTSTSDSYQFIRDGDEKLKEIGWIKTEIKLEDIPYEKRLNENHKFTQAVYKLVRNHIDKTDKIVSEIYVYVKDPQVFSCSGRRW